MLDWKLLRRLAKCAAYQKLTPLSWFGGWDELNQRQLLKSAICNGIGSFLVES
jgi:hypothetical protein